jgi:tetratricopeptide (TPR) repeat protein
MCQAVRLAHEAGRHEQAWRMAQAMHTYFLKTRRHTDWIRVHQWGVASARETNDLLALARIHFETGFAHQDRCSTDRRDPQEARSHLAAAMELVAAPGRTPTEAERRTRSSALEALGLLAAKLGAPREALARIDEAAEALGDIAHPRGRALFALHRGTFHTMAGEHDLAEAQLLTAHDGFAALTPPNRFNQAKALTRYAEDRRAAGLTAAALDAADRALAALDGQGTPYQTADILLLRGTLHGESGDSARAAADLAAARDLFRALTSPRASDAAGLLARYGGGASPGGDVE